MKEEFCIVNGNLELCGGNTFPFDYFGSADQGSGYVAVDFYTLANFVEVTGPTSYTENSFSSPTASFGYEFTTGGTAGYSYQLQTIPEPATWVQLIVGFSLVGWTLLHRGTNQIRA